ncbi:AAA domain-containing protein [Circinella umbellata]|nr:AAA domain-containing protein [Circinella umbellata]
MATNQQQKQARRRLKQLGKALSHTQTGWSDSEEDDHNLEVNVKSVRIGDVVMQVTPPKNPELVPEHTGPFYDNSQLGQDIFLIGPPGPLPAVRAAIHGRILVLDGIEKAERNVLPILNNLLENREMGLDDGRFLTTKDVQGSTTNGYTTFEKVSDRFLVFALGLPVPPYVGYPLDPPLRSRFQSRDIRAPHFTTEVNQIMALTNNKAPRDLVERLVSISSVLSVQPDKSAAREIDVPEFPTTIETLANLLAVLPHAHPRFFVDLLYPYPMLPTCDLEQLGVIESAYRRFGVRGRVVEAHEEITQTFSGYQLANLEAHKPLISIDESHKVHRAIATFSHVDQAALGLPLSSGPNQFGSAEFFVETPYHREIFTSMVLVHAGDHDICLVGTHKGVGKSALVRHFARNLGYTIDYIPLYRDMSSRDLLQRRSTTPKGDTVWDNSLLVEAAIHGHLAVLDGIEALSYGTLNTLQRLVCEREMQLPDGTRLINAHRYEKLMKKNNMTIEELDAKRLVPIHPSFRIIALARAGVSGQSDTKAGSWLTAEILSMFHFVVVDSLPSQEEQEVLKTLSPGVNEAKLHQLLTFARRLRREKDETIRMLSSALSTRQLIRICRRLAYFEDENLYKAIHKAALSRFMPIAAKTVLHELMIANGIYPAKNETPIQELEIEVLPSREDAQQVRIGNVVEPVFKGGDPMLIPNVVFHENPAHTEILREMLKDYQLGDHLLLIGNQGVGKNKLADYFLQLLQLPREYIQLHRDSTVQSLTTTPAIRDGVLIFEDSPLVKAVRDGTILVVDEADKAPTYVTAVLKSLVEDGQMVLGDGRRIVAKESDVQDGDRYLLIHPNFRMIVLANRPGYPFLGNDFYREIGDVFSCHAVDNPDKASEMYLLREYGPDVPEDMLEKLSSAFTDLRKLVDEGLISYPYSTRELVNIVLHLQNYPEEGISKIMQNVFDFDQYDQASKELLIEIFEKHGIPVGLESEFTMNLGDIVDIGEPLLSERWTRVDQAAQLDATVETAPMAIRGGWELDVGKKWKQLERKEGRSTTFSEQLYNFTIPTRGEALDIASLDDGTLFVVTTNPVTLHRVDARHQRVDSLDLYEYFPLQRAPPRLRIAVVRIKGFVKYLALHNPSNNELLCCDFNKNTVTSVVLRGMEPVKSVMCDELAALGILVFYQEDKAGVAVLDFNTTKQHTITLPTRIEQLLVVEPNLWFARGSRDAKTYTFYSKNEGIPSVLESIEILGQNGQPVGEVENIFWNEFAPGFKFAQNGKAHKFGTIVQGCNYDNFINKSGPIDLLAYLVSGPVEDVPKRIKGCALYLNRSQQMAVIKPSPDGRPESFLDIINPVRNQVWRIKIPLADMSNIDAEYPAATFARFQVERHVASMCELNNGNLVTMDASGVVRVWQVQSTDLYNAAQTWKQMVGVDQNALSIIYETDKNEEGENVLVGEASGEGDGEGQGKGEGKGKGQGSGGGQGSGDGNGGGESGDAQQGSSGGGGSGAGAGMNEGGREEATFEDIENLKLRSANDQPEIVSEAQREMHEQSMEKMLSKLDMTHGDYNVFQKYMENVRREIRELRVILESTEAKNKERVWLKNQTSGDLDDTKIIEGLTGERAIYRKRGEDDPEIGLFQDKPKRMKFVFDLSASMYRFNTHDRRLERSLEVALMMMESFRGFEHKFAYSIIGHSGDGANIEFVVPGKYPKTEKEEFEIINKMRAHSQYCLSGDNTLGAASHSIKEIVKDEGDDYFVVVLSDANITQYNIHPNDIARVLKSDDRVTAQMIFIGSLQDQAERLKQALGSQAHICAENKDLPKIMKALFLSSMLK